MNQRIISSLKKGCTYKRNWQMTGRSTAGIETDRGGPVSEYSDAGVKRLFETACERAIVYRLNAL